MKRIALAACLFASATWMNEAVAQVRGLIDRPSPPPCAADGMCYPNTESWGYYPSRWRTWPGVALEPVPATAEPTPADLGPELVPHETPPPEMEEQQAPPASPRRRLPITPPQAQPSGEDGDAEAAPPETPPSTAEPSADADPPPALPLSFSPNGFRPAATAIPTSDDPPPAPPWAHSASL